MNNLKKFDVVASASCFRVLSPQLGDEARRVGDEGRLAFLTAVRDRRQERRIGLDQHLIRRQPFGRRLQVLRILERHDPRQRNVEAEIQSLAREFGRPGEAMEDARYAALLDRSVEDFRSILLCIASVDHQRQSRLPRGLDMRLETLALRGAVGLVVIIIEPAFADGDHARVVGRFDESRRAKIGMRVGFVRVDPDAGPDVGLALGDGNDVAPFALAGGDIEEACYAAFARTLKHFGLAFYQAFVIEVAMAVDQPHAAASSSSGSSSRGKSGVGCPRRKSLSASGEYQWLRMPSNVRSSDATPISSSSRSALPELPAG